ncbi:NUDIX hydrolase [Saccharopolyspora cebuensis]|uniref:NUDIX hydrolase n=1 Tax=Saccharopolyspora cebuensis TaxID=418759 RepID=A0ABV4CEI5_9PSEU
MATDSEPVLTTWTIHGEKLLDDTRRLKLSVASVELPDGVTFEQYVLRMPKAAMTVVVDSGHVLMIWRHRFILDKWVWELPGGYVDPDEDPALTAAREVEEETGWRPLSVEPFGAFQPITGTADFENLLFLAEGAEDTGAAADVNETARVAWIDLDEVPAMVARGEIPGAAAQVALFKLLAARR